MGSRTPQWVRPSDWLDFWNGAQHLYVNDRHREVHFRDTSARILALARDPGAHLLDYGPGEATYADQIAAAVGRLTLCEAADQPRRKLAARFAGNPKVHVVQPAALAELVDSSVDLMVVNSVVQYLRRDELRQLLVLARRLLTPDGRLVIGDVIPRRASVISEVAAILRLASRERFLVAAVASLVVTAFSPYSRIRARLGLSRYDEADMVALLGAAGFAAVRQPFNLSHNPARLTFVATPHA
ncbi:class I SAM-dependent methyltransferase [Salinispora arenicola]|uniref:Methyltransferase family protein n=1 Tax=Salinispora arenicola TaxID=168697 RepID=A0A542XTC3_SALAC|nr:methyltransferase [Salinispora arenicola]MCN0151996.1 class I SAM-dependent methyltransferase [Salinispora arenicola]TQL39091.1 methyltransferase family protein [Salinispora arenicola]GIM86910.1 hypothetical protein Sar04_36460 [Salinispora arenicola]